MIHDNPKKHISWAILLESFTRSPFALALSHSETRGSVKMYNQVCNRNNIPSPSLGCSRLVGKV